MNPKPLMAAMAIAMLAGTTTPAFAQPAGGWQRDGRYQNEDVRNGVEMRQGGAWDGNAFWRGAPRSVGERVDWLQRRIDRGVADGSLDRREMHGSQYELNDIRRTAKRLRWRNGGELTPRDSNMLQTRLDDLSQKIRWQRQGGAYGAGYGGASPGGPDRSATNYDATRYYRDDPRYQERQLSSNDEVYRGSDGRYYCKRNDGTTGLIIGAVAGGVLGNLIDGGHNRVAGTLVGGTLGAIAGKSIDQSTDIRCR